MIWHKLMACGAITLGSVVTVSACVVSSEDEERATGEDLGAGTAALQERHADPDPDSRPACDSRDPTRRYIARSPQRCAAIRFYCADREEAFFDECGCGCQSGPQGEPCGDVICGPGERCCNASCSICVGPDGACTDAICGPSR